MKLMKFFSILVFSVLCCNIFAHENKCIFVGQKGNGESAKTAFLLEISAEELNDSCVVGENGEMYLKVDRIISIPKTSFADFAVLANFADRNAAEKSTEENISGKRDSQEVKCPDCKQYYNPQIGKGCPNSFCPSNKK